MYITIGWDILGYETLGHISKCLISEIYIGYVLYTSLLVRAYFSVALLILQIIYTGLLLVNAQVIYTELLSVNADYLYRTPFY